MGNPFALLGLLAVAIPIVIHLLGRYQARVEKFPTLQFIGYARLTARSRLRLTDWKLLLVRMAIVTVAALALTQPSCSRSGESSHVLTRVVIVDTSASMSRLTPSGPVAAVVARQTADRESMGVVESPRVETNSPADALPGAIAWLADRPGLREIVIVSDFQRGTIDSTDLASIPASMGLTLDPIAVVPRDAPRVAAAPQSGRDDIVTLAGAADSAGANASWRAIGRARPADTTARIAILYRGASLRPNTVPIDSPWMARIVTSLQRDRTLSEAADNAVTLSQARAKVPSGVDTVATNRRGEPVLTAGRNGSRLQFEVLDDAGSLLSAAFNAALISAVTPSSSGAETDSTSWTAEDVARWQRPATPVEDKTTDASQARWLWLVCLGLIGAEYFLRGRTDVSPRVARGDA